MSRLLKAFSKYRRGSWLSGRICIEDFDISTVRRDMKTGSRHRVSTLQDFRPVNCHGRMRASRTTVCYSLKSLRRAMDVEICNGCTNGHQASSLILRESVDPCDVMRICRPHTILQMPRNTKRTAGPSPLLMCASRETLNTELRRTREAVGQTKPQSALGNSALNRIGSFYSNGRQRFLGWDEESLDFRPRSNTISSEVRNASLNLILPVLNVCVVSSLRFGIKNFLFFPQMPAQC